MFLLVVDAALTNGLLLESEHRVHQAGKIRVWGMESRSEKQIKVIEIPKRGWYKISFILALWGYRCLFTLFTQFHLCFPFYLITAGFRFWPLISYTFTIPATLLFIFVYPEMKHLSDSDLCYSVPPFFFPPHNLVKHTFKPPQNKCKWMQDRRNSMFELLSRGYSGK